MQKNLSELSSADGLNLYPSVAGVAYMAPRANWKGFLRLSLVTCPVALYPATSDAEKISFNQINRNTGHRIRYVRVDSSATFSSSSLLTSMKVSLSSA